MNLTVRGIDADIRWNNEGSFHKDELKDLRFDFILANPPFNISDWGGDRLREDARWTYGAPPVGNANYAWLQHILWHLAPNGTAGVVLANGSMSSAQSGEDGLFVRCHYLGWRPTHHGPHGLPDGCHTS
jgi:type I restriction enzyme M protein